MPDSLHRYEHERLLNGMWQTKLRSCLPKACLCRHKLPNLPHAVHQANVQARMPARRSELRERLRESRMHLGMRHTESLPSTRLRNEM